MKHIIIEDPFFNKDIDNEVKVQVCQIHELFVLQLLKDNCQIKYTKHLYCVVNGFRTIV